ncbi:Cu2+-exporting ATPase [Bradyrhizobium sp. R2.2-H]|jgi:Cu2+-exporting ATPase|uniref:cation-translocating P-type ATPase n=1 Tax=unclassified Bradyrhizobium TaxID=2631580 RepID=UPI001047D1B0|nr:MULTISPECIES: cation-translocating P-type ATPase [unclassified Bradyrhizobium]TCU63996.1 Cu2+-exporting ATPase [Bradyrhizobium sp. Y-H1]TCU65914.1 Cu2+-exporting ATPase [Bradyrhizobium sp. R2.2-H]
MSCCAPGAEVALATADPHTEKEEVRLASRAVGNGVHQTDLSVPSIHCGGCIHKVEAALGALPGVESARVSLSSKRVAIRWQTDKPPAPFVETLAKIGYDAHLHDAGTDKIDDSLNELIRSLAVAGFAASNIMLLSVSVWSGAEASTRNMFHWISALIALPALIYSGRVFYSSAWRALRHGQTNMDVPISIGVLLAFGMSVYETLHHEANAYFDAAISLLFFLLIGRTLDHMMRERARTAVRGLVRLCSRGALVVQDDGKRAYLPVNEIRPNMHILLTAGERVPVDSRVETGHSEIDCALVSGESLPQPVSPGTMLSAGTLNLTAPLTVVATAAAKDSFLAEMVRMMEAAEGGRSVYRRVADRASRLYAPVVHLTALLTFISWMIVDGDLHRAATIAIAVLIITCPCALGLAVPMVQVVAARRLFESGVMVKDGGALERIAEVDVVIFDKTGTLTMDRLRLIDCKAVDPAAPAIAASIAAHSRHPYSRALAAAGSDNAITPVALNDVSEQQGTGMQATIGTTIYRLGRADWALTVADEESSAASVVLSANGRLCATFKFQSDLRPDVRESVLSIHNQECRVEIMSGDRDEPVRHLASALGLPYRAGVSPAGKTEHIAELTEAGRRVLMVGDGLNDTPALVAAHASMAPATAADVGRNAADLVFLHDSLIAVPQAIAVARDARRLVRQNLILTISYNAVAVPVAILGHVTPLVAAVAMSASSLLVIANAMRLHNRLARDEPRADAPALGIST